MSSLVLDFFIQHAFSLMICLNHSFHHHKPWIRHWVGSVEDPENTYRKGSETAHSPVGRGRDLESDREATQAPHLGLDGTVICDSQGHGWRPGRGKPKIPATLGGSQRIQSEQDRADALLRVLFLRGQRGVQLIVLNSADITSFFLTALHHVRLTNRA